MISWCAHFALGSRRWTRVQRPRSMARSPSISEIPIGRGLGSSAVAVVAGFRSPRWPGQPIPGVGGGEKIIAGCPRVGIAFGQRGPSLMGGL